MRLPPLLALLKWAVSLALLGGLLLGLFLARGLIQAEQGEDEEGSRARSRPPAREGVVHLEEDEAERYGLEAEPARETSWQERVAVYGRVVPNPGATAEVRSPFGGTLREAPGSPWPAPGQRLHAGQTVGYMDVRVAPEVRLDLHNKLSEARLRQRGAEEVLKVQESRADSLRRVTDQELLSRGELDAALVQLAEARTQLAVAQAATGLWEKALRAAEAHQADGNSPWRQPLTAPADGEVTDLAGRPGMAVEAGAWVVQLVDFRRPLVRLDVPPEVLAAGGPPSKVEVRPTAPNPPALGGVLSPQPAPALQPAEAHLAGTAPQVDAASQLVGCWYHVRVPAPAGALWRPCLQVKALLLAAGGGSQPAVVVPADAVLYHEGRPLVYVRTGPDRYQRREVRLLGREGDRWVVARREGATPVGVAPGEPVVSRQAQVLLSEEFRGAAAENDD
jgi:hypothetical protein